MRKCVFLCVVLLTGISGFSQNSYSIKIVDEETGESLPGATVQITELSLGKVSDTDGRIIFENLPSGTFTFSIRFVGYEYLEFIRTFPLDTSSEVIGLHPREEEMEAVVVSSTRSSRLIEDIPTRVEVIAGEELSEKGNMKPGDIRMLLNESTGIQTQQTSATSYNSSIRIQGLDGKYTQLMRDGLPLYAGYSGGLSLMQIPPLDLAQVEVIKGSASTLYGGGAIAGLVNLISKEPTREGGLDLMVNGTSALGLDVSSFYSKKHNRWGTTVFASLNKGTAYDPADIGLTAIPEFQRITLNPKVFWNPGEKSRMMLGVNWTIEDRLGGNVDYIRGEAVTNPYFEENLTDRVSTQLTFSHLLSESTVLQFKNSLNVFSRDIRIPNYSFGGKQVSSFSELHLTKSGTRSEWIGGLNLWTENFTQGEGDVSNPLDYRLNTLGAFVQNLANISQMVTLETGLRVDRQAEYGIFTLPRFSLMVEPNEQLTLRLGGGLGYKSPTVFTEEAERVTFRNVLPVDPGLLEAERSAGANLDVNYRMAWGENLVSTINILGFYTRIDDPLILELDQGFYSYQQPGGTLLTRGAEVNMKWQYHDLKLFIGYTFSEVTQETGQSATRYPLVARHRLNNVLMYEKHEKFRVGLEAYYYSPQLLSDGTTGRAYWITGLMTEKKFGENFSLFLNFENFLDTRQTAFDTIFSGTLSDPQFREIYAPVDGFVINGGFKLHL